VTVVVTGANGFVGSHVVRLLAAQGHEVRACVRSTSRMVDRTGAEVIEVGDLSSSTDWRLALAGVTTVIHAAAVTRTDKRLSGSMATLEEVNIGATLRLASCAAAMGVKRLVFISSIKVNGETSARGRPFRAEDPPSPEDGYSRSKADAERGLMELAETSTLEVVIVRPPLIYGRGVKGNFRSMVSLVRSGVPLPLASITENRRSMIAVDNLASALSVCALHPAAAGRIFMVKDGADLSTADMLAHMARAVGKPLRLFRFPERILRLGASLLRRESLARRVMGDLQCDDGPMRNLLGWRPVIDIEQAFRDACEPDKNSSFIQVRR
jgi:nucleoside-diphosphate-sugar epimerase